MQEKEKLGMFHHPKGRKQAAGISLTEELYGVSFRKESDVTAVFNDFMAKLKADGTLQALADKYSLTLADWFPIQTASYTAIAIAVYVHVKNKLMFKI